MVRLVFKNEIKKYRRLQIYNFEDLGKKHNAWNTLPKVAFEWPKTKDKITFLGGLFQNAMGQSRNKLK